MAKTLGSMKVGILGPGAVGSLLAGLFQRSGEEVYCFGTRRAMSHIAEHGIHVKSKVYGNFHIRTLEFAASLREVDILFITVKSYALNDALITYRNCVGPDTLIISLLNGVGHREVIRRTLNKECIVGTIGAVEVSLDSDRCVHHKSEAVPRIEIGVDESINATARAEISCLIENAGIDIFVSESEKTVIWSKLVRLCAIATMTSLTDLTVGQVRSDVDLRLQLVSLVQELCQIASSEGVFCDAESVLNQIDALPYNLTTSMQRDLSSSHCSEIESILGRPLEMGMSIGLNLPALESAYSSLKSRTVF